jgi:KaiC/GvpD/RAD55 family RecA-like ATPase
MGLLAKAEEKRGKLLKKLTKEKKKYIDHVRPNRKKVITEGIRTQRKVLKKFQAKVSTQKPLKRKIDLPTPNIKPVLQASLLSKAKVVLKRGTQTKQIKPLKAKKLEKLPKGPGTHGGFDVSAIKQSIEKELGGDQGTEWEESLSGPRKAGKGFMYTGVQGFDSLLEKGIPRGAAVLVAGGAGSGKTIFGLQTLMHHVSHGEKCLYMSFEESEEKLIKHMEDFGWNPKKYIKSKKLVIKRFNPFEITRNVDALLMQAKGELLIDVKPIIFPMKITPDLIVVDSLTAIASAFTGKEDSYRIYIEQLFRFFENINATSFLITETEQVPKIFSTTGVEEFLADVVVVLYNIKRGNVRERALEVLKLRGAGHKHRIVAVNITKAGIEVFPEQEVFGEVGGN